MALEMLRAAGALVCLSVWFRAPVSLKPARAAFPVPGKAPAFTKMHWQLLRALCSPRHLQIDLFPCFQVEKISGLSNDPRVSAGRPGWWALYLRGEVWNEQEVTQSPMGEQTLCAW